jgi:hypothetical protein
LQNKKADNSAFYFSSFFISSIEILNQVNFDAKFTFKPPLPTALALSHSGI